VGKRNEIRRKTRETPFESAETELSHRSSLSRSRFPRQRRYYSEMVETVSGEGCRRAVEGKAGARGGVGNLVPHSLFALVPVRQRKNTTQSPRRLTGVSHRLERGET
jgi:hypothetical protein